MNNGNLRELSPDAVEQLQYHLQNLGFYHGNVDGNWGRETSEAVADFQGQHGLQQTGQLNLATAAQLGLLGGGNGGGNYSQGFNKLTTGGATARTPTGPAQGTA